VVGPPAWLVNPQSAVKTSTTSITIGTTGTTRGGGLASVIGQAFRWSIHRAKSKSGQNR
jgi:hypothetical protein